MLLILCIPFKHLPDPARFSCQMPAVVPEKAASLSRASLHEGFPSGPVRGRLSVFRLSGPGKRCRSLNFVKAFSQHRDILLIVKSLHSLQVIFPYKESLFLLPCLHKCVKDVLILGLSQNESRILSHLRVRVVKKTRQDRKIASQQVHKLPPEALIFDSVPEGDQILPDLIAAGNAVV